MKTKQKNKQQGKHKVSPDRKPTRAWWILGVGIVLAAISIILWQNNSDQRSTRSSSIPSSVTVPNTLNKDILVGRWVRTDSNGGYTIEIKSAADDGKLNANYFNPNPIIVGRAEWQQKNGKLIVVVELRDVNYPGSTYTLEFHDREDRMVGTYFQAVEGMNYDVEFVRE